MHQEMGADGTKLMNEVLLQQLALGSREAFTAIYQQYHNGIYNYLLKFTRNPAQTEDLVHDVFLKIWEIREQLDIKKSFDAYLYRLARNTALTQLNRIALYDTIRDEIMHRLSLGLNDHSLMNEVESRQYEQLLQKAIDSLPPQRREAFILCRQQGKSYEEAAALMNISRNTFKQHLSLAVKSIRDYLLENGSISLLVLLVSLK
ncbi:RNA polymerase sigma-70 factor, ECF subfamily [Chitinophaga terrae (ex Kim and Jung 2007)]|uniref:RNA polymerase sigma-70 factor, ECF subfamily n=2 Tax=Chitinophaga terrae (ex Kim and Jung 2007) TaxID=408074 RepID=A0A1H4AVE6_9BACT|nr:RNA polymerase sigma-70 factor [Chitinophaga terrae (ex Kim and Jung 2007)]SEA39899.1 RNA polymerase sigma-70 factor, ECF subfamily [Chitinophaga terrae (ex Kim and Jung 2007)]